MNFSGNQPQQVYIESARRFAEFYYRYTIENQANFEQIEIEFGNILSSLEIHQAEKDWHVLASLIVGLDVYCDGKGYWQLLRFWLEVAWKKKGFINDQSIVLKILLNLAQMCNHLGERKRAMELYEKAISLATKLKNDAQLGAAYFGLGTAYQGIGNQSKAIEYWKKAQSFSRKAGDEIQLAGINYFLELHPEEGTPSAVQEEWRSRDPFVKVLSMMGKEGEAALLMIEATKLLVSQEFLKAQPLFEKAHALFKASGEMQGQALAVFNLGIIAQRQNRLDDALDFYRESLHLAEELNDSIGLSSVYSSLGFLHLQRQEWTSSRYYLEKGLEILRASGDKESIAKDLYWLGYSRANSGDIDGGIEAFAECQAMLKRLRKPTSLNPEEQLAALRKIKKTSD